MCGKRILVVSEHVLGNAGYVDDVVAYLRDVRGYHVDLEIIRPSTPWRRWLATAQIPKVRFYDLDFSAARWHHAYSAEARARVDSAIRETAYDGMFIHTQNAALCLAGRMRDLPTIVSGDATNIQLADLGWNARGRYTRFTWLPSIRAESKAYAAARWVTKMCHWAADSVRRDYRVPGNKIVVAPPLVPTVAVYPTRANSLIQLLFVGNDFFRKGGQDLLDVFLKEFQDTCELHIVSKGRINLPSHSRIHLHTGLSKTDDHLRRLYASSDIFVFPTRRDLIPNVLREAMAMGLPVVTTPLAAIPEIVQNGKTGLFVSPGDRDSLSAALRRLIASPAMREELGRASLERAEQLNIESLAGREMLFS
jgi:starch synthase